MRSAARQEAPADVPDTRADLDATLVRLRAALPSWAARNPATALEIADIGVTLQEIRAALLQGAEALACDGHLAELQREIGRAGRGILTDLKGPRPARSVLRVLPT